MPGNGATSAKNAKIRTGAGPTTLEAAEWSVNDSITEIDDTSFEDGGYGSRIGGVKDAEVSIKGFWNATANQHTSPLNIYAGATLSTTKLYLNDTTGKYWDFPSLLILTVNEVAAVRQGINYDFTAKNDGTYTPPA